MQKLENGFDYLLGMIDFANSECEHLRNNLPTFFDEYDDVMQVQFALQEMRDMVNHMIPMYIK